MTDIRHLALIKNHEQARQTATGPIIDTARIIRQDADQFLLLTAGSLALRATKAAGCLLEPEENDTVLIVRNSPEGSYILTILSRSGADSRIKLPGNATVCAEGETLRLSGDSVVMSGKKTASVDAPEIFMQGGKGDISFVNLSLTASVAEAKAGRLSLVASAIDTVCERLTQRLKDCFRRVARMDSTTAGHLRINTENRFDLKAGAASITAECEVKIDGDKIHLG